MCPIGIGYARQSRARPGESEADALSLDAQESEIRAWEARNPEWTVERIVRDHDLSGGNLDRPGWQEVRQLVAGGGYDGVITAAVSRIARDHLLQEVTWRELQAQRATIISIREPNIEDDVLRGILGVFGQAARKRISRFVTAAIRERRRRGLHHGAAPFGMRLTGRAGERGRTLERDPDTGPVARAMIDRLLAGETTHAVYRWLAGSGVPPPFAAQWSDATVRRWFGRPSIAGGARIDGELVWDRHPALCTVDEWHRLQRLIANTRRRHECVRIDSWLRGAIRHGCGGTMTGDTHTHPSGNRHLSFRCVDPACTLRPRKGSAAKLGRAAAEALLTDLATIISPRDALSAWRAAHHGAEQATRRLTLERERQRLTGAHTRAEALYIAGRRDASWLAGHDERFTARDRAIAAELAALDVPPDLARLDTIHRASRDWRETWRLLDWTQQGAILRQLGRVVVSGDTLAIAYDEPVSLLVPCPTVVVWR